MKWLFFSACMIAIYVALYAYSHPTFLNRDPEAEARRFAAAALEDCLYIFQEIGEILEENQMPDPSLRCDDSELANIITRDGDTIRISHPNPQIHGFNEIFVTNSNHDPTLVK